MKIKVFIPRKQKKNFMNSCETLTRSPSFSFPFQLVPDSQTPIIMTVRFRSTQVQVYLLSLDNYSSSLSIVVRNRSFNIIDLSGAEIAVEDSCLRFHRFITFFQQTIQMTIVDCKILSLIICFYCSITI